MHRCLPSAGEAPGGAGRGHGGGWKSDNKTGRGAAWVPQGMEQDLCYGWDVPGGEKAEQPPPSEAGEGLRTALGLGRL